MKAVPASRYVAYALLAGGGAALDLTTKSWVFGKLGPPGLHRNVWWFWDGVFGLETSLNEGALFGFGGGFVWIFALLSTLAASGIAYWLFVRGAAQSWLLTIALGAITGGILGNLYDRLGLHQLVWPVGYERAGERVYAVRDWILFQLSDAWRWPNFNIADALLVCGAIVLLWELRKPPEPAPAPTQADR